MLTRVKVAWVVLALGGLSVGCGETASPRPVAEGGVANGGQAGMTTQGGSSGGILGSGGLAGGGAGAATQAGSAGDGGGGAGAGGDATAGTGGTAGAAGGGGAGGVLGYPPKSDVVEVLARVNKQFADKWPDPATTLPGSRPSNIWTRGVYFEGLMALNGVAPQKAYLDYALDWAEYHDWGMRAPITNADNQCAGQTYFDLYVAGGASDPMRIAVTQKSVDDLVNSASNSHWTWIDAIQMSMPLFAQLGAQTGKAAYFSRMYALYSHTKKTEGGGLYDAQTHLWWRDAKWKPPQLTPSGKNVYWSRGNGWVFAALVRVLERLPMADSHRAEYERDFIDMAAALRPLQRDDGFWNASLADPTHFGGPEVTGTSLFTYGMAWGIRRGLLTEAEYGAAVRKAWSGMLKVSVRADGFLGFAQSTGDDPSDGQPLSADKQPDFEDYGVGCFLLGGSEVAKLSANGPAQ